MKRLVLALALLSACHPLPVAPLDPSGLPPRADDELPPPNRVMPTTEADARACVHLAELGCPEAWGCLSAFSAARTDGVIVPSLCIAGAADVVAVRHCGDPSTLTVECRK